MLIVRLDEILEIYFDESKRNVPYDSVEEYEKDSVRFLDILLSIACSMCHEVQDNEQCLEIENAHLRGVPITGQEVIAALMQHASGYVEDIPYEEIKQVLLEAKDYIEQRVNISAIRIPVRKLADKLGLSEWEQFLILLAGANFLDAKYELIFAFLQRDTRMKLPSLRLASSLYGLFQETKRSELVRTAEGKGILFEIVLKPQELYDNIKLGQTYTLRQRIYGWLGGDKELYSGLKGKAVRFDYEEELEPIQVREQDFQKVKQLMHILLEQKKGQIQVFHLYGQYGNGRRFLVKHAAKALKKSVLFVDVSEIIGNHANVADTITMEETWNMLFTECVLEDLIICFFYQEHKKADAEKEEISASLLSQFVKQCGKRFPLFLWISEEKAEYLLGQEFRYIGYEIKNLEIKERYELWEGFSESYPVSNEIDFRLISNQFLFTIREIQDTLWNADLHRRCEGREKIEKEDIRMAIRQQSWNQLGHCAQSVPALYTWDDLVLPEESNRQLKLLCDQVKYKNVVGEEWGFYEKTAYGRGVCALFSGAPGTGKTMAVQVIANELGLNLYRVDLSQLISKYVGETEKNISKVFARARGINALLFFDEADSLFTKRLDIRDSMDRSANAQTGHLLQEIENYDGITILATNLAMNLDDAFKRRIKFIVKFSFPTEEVRLKLWKSIMPAKVPCAEEIAFEFYAKKFELSGSSIKEILTSAAYFAAAESRKLTNQDVIEAIKMNYSKYGKTLSKDEFEYLL